MRSLFSSAVILLCLQASIVNATSEDCAKFLNKTRIELSWKNSKPSVQVPVGKLVSLKIIDAHLEPVVRVTDEEYPEREKFVREQLAYWRQTAGEDFWKWYKLMMVSYNPKQPIATFSSANEAEEVVRRLYTSEGFERADHNRLTEKGNPVYKWGEFYYRHYSDTGVLLYSEEGRINGIVLANGFPPGLYQAQGLVKTDAGSNEPFSFLMQVDGDTNTLRIQQGIN